MQERATSKRAALVVAALVAVVAAALSAAVAPPPAAATDYPPPPGDLLWMQTWHPSLKFGKYGAIEIVRGPGGDLWVGVHGSAMSSDSPYTKRMCVARFSPGGARRWGKVIPSPVEMDFFESLAVDRGRNAILVGERSKWSTETGSPWLVAKVSPAGKVLWTKTVASPAQTSALAADVAVDSAGNIYAVGTMARTATGSDLALVKMSPTGAVQWRRYIDGYAGSTDVGVAVTVDPRDRVYVTGTVGSFFAGKDVVIARYTTAGRQVWKQVWDGQGLDDTAADIDANSSKVAVAATSAGSAGYRRVALLAALPDMNGKAVDATTFTLVDWDSTLAAIDVNGAGDIAAAGTTSQGGIRRVVYALWAGAGAKYFSTYAPAGEEAWAYGVALSPTGAAVMAGSASSSSADRVLAMSVPFGPGSPWYTAPTLPSRGAGSSVVATAGGVFVAGQYGRQVGVWKFQP